MSQEARAHAGSNLKMDCWCWPRAHVLTSSALSGVSSGSSRSEVSQLGSFSHSCVQALKTTVGLVLPLAWALLPWADLPCGSGATTLGRNKSCPRG